MSRATIVVTIDRYRVAEFSGECMIKVPAGNEFWQKFEFFPDAVAPRAFRIIGMHILEGILLHAMHKQGTLVTSVGDHIKLVGTRMEYKEMGKAFTWIVSKEMPPMFTNLEQACSWFYNFGVKHPNAPQLEINGKLYLANHFAILTNESTADNCFGFAINYGGDLSVRNMVAAAIMTIYCGPRFDTAARSEANKQFTQVTYFLWWQMEEQLGSQASDTLAEFAPSSLYSAGPPSRLKTLPMTKTAAISDAVRMMKFAAMSKESQNSALNFCFPRNAWRWSSLMTISNTYIDETLALGGLRTL